MEKSTFDRIACLAQDFVRLHLTGVESATIDAIDHCSEEKLVHYTGRRSSDPHFMATLTLKFMEEGISERGTGRMGGLTLVLNDERVTETLWHGIDIWPNIDGG